MGRFPSEAGKRNAYNDSDLNFLEQLAKQIAVAVDTSLAHEIVRTYQEQLARDHAQLRLLQDISNALMKHLDTEHLFREISKCIGASCRTTTAACFCTNRPLTSLRTRAIHSPHGADFARA